MAQGYGARTQNYEEYRKDHEYYEAHKRLKGRRTPKQMAEEIKKHNALGKENIEKGKTFPDSWINKANLKDSKQEAIERYKKKKALGTGLKDIDKEKFNDSVKKNLFNEETHYAGEELYSDDPNRFGIKMREYNEKMNPTVKETHYAGEELYNDDPNRYGDKMRKYNEKMNPTPDANERLLQQINKKEYSSVIERYNKDEAFRNSLKQENENLMRDAKKDMDTYLKGGADTSRWDTDDDFIDDLAREYDIEKAYLQKEFDEKKSYKTYVEHTLNNEDYLRENNPGAHLMKMVEEHRKKKSARLGKGLNSLGKEKMSGKGVKDLFKR